MGNSLLDLDNLTSFTKPFTVGFDQMLKPLVNAGHWTDGAVGFPSYNIARQGDRYFVTLAVAGYHEEHLSVETEGNELWIKGTKVKEAEDWEIYHRGLARRSFERKFVLADGVTVLAVTLAYGLLTIELQAPEDHTQVKRVVHDIGT
jgi:molecular chaperone IbpA